MHVQICCYTIYPCLQKEACSFEVQYNLRIQTHEIDYLYFIKIFGKVSSEKQNRICPLTPYSHLNKYLYVTENTGKIPHSNLSPCKYLCFLKHFVIYRPAKKTTYSMM